MSIIVATIINLDEKTNKLMVPGISTQHLMSISVDDS